MEKVVGDGGNLVKLSDEEAKNICRLGEGERCCAFLALGSGGFKCIRMDYPNNTPIFDRLEDGTMIAKGEGGWEGCTWMGMAN